MNQGKLVQKSNHSNRDAKLERKKKDNKEKEKNTLQNNSSIQSSTRTNIKSEKHRSSSLSRQSTSNIKDSGKKSQSVERSKQEVSSNNSLDLKSTQKNIKYDKDKKGNSYPQTFKNESSSKMKTIIPKTSSKSQKIKNVEKHKSSEPKTNLQIAKSFVKKSQPSSSKVSKIVSKKDNGQKQNTLYNEGNDILERPKTSTIRKGPTESLTGFLDVDNIGTSLKNEKQLSRSRTSLNGASEDDNASYEEDFEDYDSDFEESDSVSQSESDDSESDEVDDEKQEVGSSEEEDDRPQPSLRSDTFESSVSKAPILEKQKANDSQRTFLKMSDRTSLFSEQTLKSSPEKKQVKSSRSFISFEAVIRDTEDSGKQNNNPYEVGDEESVLSSADPYVPPVAAFRLSTISNPNLKQVFVQTENSYEQDVQTDDVDMCNKWTQNPTNTTAGCGGDEANPVDDKKVALKSLFNVHSTKLSNFLQRSSNIILTLLDEEFSMVENDYKAKKRRDFFYSDGFQVLPPPNFLSGIPIVHIYASQNSPFLITIHDHIQSPDVAMEEKGIICVWNLFNYSKPEYILMANGQPSCGTFDPGLSDIVIAGMVDGAVMLWDLSETYGNHLMLNESTTLRSPTYNTALILGEESHRSCIVSIQAVYSNSKEDSKLSSLSKSGSVRNFHVITLEDMGTVNIWVVVEVLKPDISGVETDLGLAPGGKYRLIRSSCLHLSTLATLPMKQKNSIRTFDFRMIPFDTSRMLITSDTGIVLHVSRHNTVMEPRAFASETDFSPEIHCIDYSLHNEELFLVACSDGSIKLHNIKFVRPLLEFLPAVRGESISLLRWSPVHPTVFCVLSSDSRMHLWDLMVDSTRPHQSYSFDDCKVTWFAFRNVENSQSKSGNFSSLLIAKGNGEVEVHAFKRNITPEEYQRQLQFMQRL